MNVGELRRALDNVSDAQEVCFKAGPIWYRLAEKAETQELLPVTKGPQIGLCRKPGPFSKEPSQLIFVIE